MKDPWPSLEEVWAHLRDAERTGFCKVQSIGKSVEARDIPVATVTDSAVADDDKEVCILLAGEHGDEKSGVTSMLRMLDWLLSDDARAVAARRKQTVHILPCVNVDGYVVNKGFTAQDVDLYVAFSPDSPSAAPEAKAVWDFVERTVPDVFVNLHGGRFEDTQRPFLTNTVTAFHPSIAEQMDLAADEGGWPQGREWEFEHFPAIPDSLSRIERPGRPAVPFSSNIAAAAKKFHTLSVLMHTDTEEECVLRLQKLIEIGNSAWSTEHYTGYPNRILRAQGCGLLSVCGRTPGQRRRSRTELSANLDGLFLLSASCPVGRAILVLHRRTKPFIHHGASIRFRIPRGSKVKELRLNGDLLSPSEGHGYVEWQDPRWSVVQANLLESWPSFSTRAKGGDTIPADIAVLILEYEPPQ